MEHGCSKAEMDTVYLKEPAVDLFQVLAQQVFLMLSAKKVCSEGCRGLCPQCGMNLNVNECDCGKGTGASPFSVLANLKKS